MIYFWTFNFIAFYSNGCETLKFQRKKKIFTFLKNTDNSWISIVTV